MKILLLANYNAGISNKGGVLKELSDILFNHFGKNTSVKILMSHNEIREYTVSYLRKIRGKIVIISAGGGGTLRAVVEGIAFASKDRFPARVCIAVLRMGFWWQPLCKVLYTLF